MACYKDEVLADTPVGYWRLGEASGTVAVDASGNGHDGTISGSPTMGVETSLGDGDTAFTFEGSSQHVVLPDANDMASTTWTVEAIYKTTGATTGTILSLCQDGTKPSMQLDISNSKLRGYLYNTDDASVIAYSNDVLSIDTLYHVAVVYNGATIQLYVDGSSDTSANMTGTPLNTSLYASIGARMQYGSYAGGFSHSTLIDEVAVYDTALSAERIAAHYAAIEETCSAGGSGGGIGVRRLTTMRNIRRIR